MRHDTPYKNYLIRGESFQREKNGSWIPQYTVLRQDAPTESFDYPSHQYQLHHSCSTEREADEFAVRKAQEWIDKND
ncbi:MAG: hypothetical protein ACRD72_25495 [Candidatus Angelobacter sp.]